MSLEELGEVVEDAAVRARLERLEVTLSALAGRVANTGSIALAWNAARKARARFHMRDPRDFGAGVMRVHRERRIALLMFHIGEAVGLLLREKLVDEQFAAEMAL